MNRVFADIVLVNACARMLPASEQSERGGMRELINLGCVLVLKE